MNIRKKHTESVNQRMQINDITQTK